MKNPKNFVNFWTVLAVLNALWLIISLIILIVIKARGLTFFITYFSTFIINSIIIVARALFKRSFALTGSKKKIVDGDEEFYENIAKNVVFEKLGIAIGQVFISGINPIQTDTGGLVVMYGIYFKDRDSAKRFVFALNTSDVQVRKLWRVTDSLTQEGYDELINSIARGRREYKVVTEEQHGLSGETVTRTTKEPVIIEPHDGEKKDELKVK